jgi:hypothetical protein
LPCGDGADLVRWGFQPRPGGSLQCVSVRASEDELWTRISAEAIEVQNLWGRECYQLDDKRVLAVGGVESMKLFPVMSLTADIVELDKLTVRAIGERPSGGYKMELPGDEIVWLGYQGGVVRFDPKTETFSTEPEPERQVVAQNSLRLDGRTFLLWEGTGDERVLVKAGFRMRPATHPETGAE